MSMVSFVTKHNKVQPAAIMSFVTKILIISCVLTIQQKSSQEGTFFKLVSIDVKSDLLTIIGTEHKIILKPPHSSTAESHMISNIP